MLPGGKREPTFKPIMPFHFKAKQLTADVLAWLEKWDTPIVFHKQDWAWLRLDLGESGRNKDPQKEENVDS